MATVELAAALPVLMLLVLVGLSAVRVSDARVRCVDAAREAARAAARGDPRAVALASRAVPAGAWISVLTADGTVTATVSLHVRSLGSVGPAVTVTGRASAAAEPAATGPQATELQVVDEQSTGRRRIERRGAYERSTGRQPPERQPPERQQVRSDGVRFVRLGPVPGAPL